MNKISLAVTAFLFIGNTISHAQSYVGHTVDNYSGVHGVLLNPASVVDSPQRADINLFSVSAFAGSDYFSTDLNNILESEDGFNFDNDMKKFPKADNQFFLNVDALGPSFMVNLTKKSSIAVTSRVRAFMNLNNINGTIYENIVEDFDTNEDFDMELENFNGTIHVWGELGLTYGRVLYNTDQHLLKAGVTLKYLQGAGATFANSPSITAEYAAAAEMLTTTGSLSYGTTPGFESEDIDFDNLSSGFGGDLGVVYQFRKAASLDSLSNSHSNYKLKVGVSVTDLGSISYAGSTENSFDLDNSVNTQAFEENDLETVLKENYQYTETEMEASVSLPTALHVLVDYNIRKRLYMSLHGSFSLNDESKLQASRIINTLTATPRLEMRWMSFYLPISLRQYDGIAMGAGLRLGPLTVGSGSIITNYISKESQTADVYVGLKIPVYR